MEEKFNIGQLLLKIDSPEELRKLNSLQLKQLCKELREYYIDVISVKGGHFAAGLGVVELTVALHYVFNTPDDQLIWDVGHQTYAHKILTGRREQFPQIRQKGGISGFPSRDESPYDSFGVGHASTSISAALGMAIADSLNGNEQAQHLAIIGDGALTGGLAFEALNHAGVSEANILIIYNDNEMSIDPPVGAISHQVVKKEWAKPEEDSSMIPNIRRVKANHLSPESFFESLNLPYYGPVDGHDLDLLINWLQKMKEVKGPRILHIKTLKGKGFLPAEQDRVKWHSTGKFDKLTGKPIHSGSKPQTLKFQEVFGHTLVELGHLFPKLVAITPAMPSGSSLNIFMKEFPHRSFDVGIAEAHAVTFAAGLATRGLKVFCSIYSTFLQRAYDQVIHDVALQRLPVVFCIDRAGLVGEDGATHHGVFDLAYLTAIPNMVVTAPLNEHELRNLMFTASNYNEGPFAIRYPRGNGFLKDWKNQLAPLEWGKGICLHKGKRMAICSTGTIGNTVLEAINDLDEKPSVYHFPYVKPLDKELVNEIIANYEIILSIEEGVLTGGFGSQIANLLAENPKQVLLKSLGLPDAFVGHGKNAELLNEVGLDKEGIIKTIGKLLL